MFLRDQDWQALPELLNSDDVGDPPFDRQQLSFTLGGWQGSVLLRDIADVKRLRAEDGPNLVTQGSTELVSMRSWPTTSSTR